MRVAASCAATASTWRSGARIEGVRDGVAQRMTRRGTIVTKMTVVGHVDDKGDLHTLDADAIVYVLLGDGDTVDPATGKPIPGMGLPEPPTLYTYRLHQGPIPNSGIAVKGLPTVTGAHISSGHDMRAVSKTAALAQGKFSMAVDRMRDLMRRGERYHHNGPCLQLHLSPAGATSLRPGRSTAVRVSADGLEQAVDVPVRGRVNSGSVSPSESRVRGSHGVKLSVHADRTHPWNDT
jgi:hypothetical protein